MKKSLLATVAAVALIAGAGFASAEGAKDQPKAGHAEMNKGGADVKAEGAVNGKAETTGQTSEKSAPAAKSAAEDKAPAAKSASEQKAAPAAKSATDEKAPAAKTANDTKAAPAAKSATDEKSAPASKSATDQKAAPAAKSAADSKPAADTKTNAAADSKAGGASANLTTEQKTKIRTTVIQSSSAPKVSRSSINFNISVGTVVPRSVRFVTVSPVIVEYYPAYRGYSYFIVDDEIIIVEPSTLRIIAVITV